MRWLHSLRRWFVLTAVALGVAAVIAAVVWILEDEEYDDDRFGVAAVVLGAGAVLVAPLAAPLLFLRSRWYRLLTLCIALVAALVYAALGLAGGFLLLPSALILLLSILTPQPP